MKKRVLSVIVTAALCAGCLAGCGGKSEKEEALTYYQEELGADREEAEELYEMAQELEDDDWESEAETVIPEEETAPEEDAFVLVDPLPEIVNSKLTDPIVQIGNSIIRLDGSVTVKEAYDIICEEFGWEDPSMGVLSEVTEKSLCQSEGFVWINGYDIELDYFCPQGETWKIYDAPVYELNALTADRFLDALNIFYAGNFCAGVYDIFSQETADDKILSQYSEDRPNNWDFAYDDLEAYFDRQGLPGSHQKGGTWTFTDSSYEMLKSGDEPFYVAEDGTEYWRGLSVWAKLNMTEGVGRISNGGAGIYKNELPSPWYWYSPAEE